MIEGLKLDFTSKQLQEHIAGRRQHHDGKQAWYAQQIASLKAGGMRQESPTSDPMDSLERSRKMHETKAELFKVMADHVIPNETYRLSESDLTRLELISGHYF